MREREWKEERLEFIAEENNEGKRRARVFGLSSTLLKPRNFFVSSNFLINFQIEFRTSTRISKIR